MEFLDINMTQLEADAKAASESTLSLGQLKYSFVVLLYVMFRDVVKYFIPILTSYFRQKLEKSTFKLE